MNHPSHDRCRYRRHNIPLPFGCAYPVCALQSQNHNMSSHNNHNRQTLIKQNHG